MFTVKLHWIPNMRTLLELAAESCGEVLLHLPGEEGLRLSLSDRGDVASLMRYLSEAAL